MSKVLLRSHLINDFQPLGEHGKPVYQSAIQLRETLRLRKYTAAADSLAVPQLNEAGDRIDWYSAYEGSVVPWTAASDSEKASALLQLEKIHEELIAVSDTLSEKDSKQEVLFASLLQKTRQFPDSSHVYLVNGKPVVTFWGFVNNLDKIRFNPLDILRPPKVQPIPEPIVEHVPVEEPPVVESEPVIEQKINWLRWLLLLLLLLLLLIGGFFLLRSCAPPSIQASLPNLGLPAVDLPEVSLPDTKLPEVEVPTVDLPNVTLPNVSLPDVSLPVVNGLSLPEGNLPAVDGLALPEGNLPAVDGLALPESTLPAIDPNAANQNEANPNENMAGGVVAPEEPQQENSNQPAEAPPGDPAVNGQEPNLAPPEIPENGQPGQPNDPASSIPNANDPNAQSQNNGTTDPNAVNPANAQAANALTDPLSIPASANANADFLNGQWRATGGIQDAKTGKPLALTYDFKDGKGNVQVTRSDGVVCQSPVNAGMQNGTLGITNNQTANCSDGTTYTLPNISCTQDAGDSAKCKGQYEGSEAFPINMKGASQ